MYLHKKGLLLNQFIGFIILILLLSSPGCSNSISLFDHYSYTQTVSLKVDALDLMDKAVKPDSLYQEQIGDLSIQMEKIYEYEKGRPQNTISAGMWFILKDRDGKLLGGFLRRWQDEKILNQVFIIEAKKLISRSFDLIAELESGKIRADEASDLFGIYILK